MKIHFIDIRDQHDSDLVAILPEAVSFIKDALTGEHEKVLVHCMRGKSRSARCVIAYLVYT